MIADVILFAEPAERADLGWVGNKIPLLNVAGVSIHLSHLGPNLGPWLLALSDQLAEFAASVAPDGSRLVAELVAEVVT